MRDEYPMSLPRYPQTALSRTLCLAGALLLLLGLWLQGRMWLAVFGWRPVAPAGAEYTIALFIGLPLLLLSVLLLGLVTLRRPWRSKVSAMLLVPALTVLAGWAGLFVRSLMI